MKKQFKMLVIGGFVATAAMGLSFTNAFAGDAEHGAMHPGAHGDMVMQSEHKMDAMAPDATGDMMKNCEMHAKMQEMMKNPEMQAKMQEMMKNPEMKCTMPEAAEENK